MVIAGLCSNGCSRSKPVDEATHGGETAANGTTITLKTADVEHHKKALAGPSEQRRRDAIAYFAQHGADATTINELVALLSDPTTAGLGKTHPGRIGSTREAAARALLALGEAGETALREQGVAVLRKGLKDRTAAVREHSAYTLGLLGPLAAAASDDLLAVAQDPEESVRRAALDALRQVGINNPLRYIALLNHKDSETARQAAELAPLLAQVPTEALEPLTTALQSSEPMVRTAAATLMAHLGPRAAPAVPALCAAIRQSYPAQFDPSQPSTFIIGADWAYWQALAAIGPAAAMPVAELLQHEHPLVRLLAATILGEMGPAAAEAAADALQKALQDPIGNVAIEAAGALLRLGVAQEAALRTLQMAIEAPDRIALSAIALLPRLGQAGQKLLPVALAQLSSDNPYARYAAVGLIATLAPEQAQRYLPQLAELTTDNQELIRQQVAVVLQKLGPAGGAAATAVARAWQQEQSEAMRDAWIDALLAMGAEARPALKTLLQAAADEQLPVNRRLRLIAALPQVDASAAATLELLLEQSRARDADIRAAAAQALGQMRPLPPAAVERLITLAQQDNRWAPRRAALLALLAAGTQAQSAHTPLQTLAQRTPPDALALLAQAASAAVAKQPARARQIVQAALRSPKADIRTAALEALLILTPTPAELPILQRLLTEPSTDSRLLAARAIGRLGPAAQSAVPQLTALLDQNEPTVQQAALEALGQMGPPARAAAERIRRLSEDPQLGAAARQTLEKLGWPAPPLSPPLPQR
jgi:HEAT repeat protein